LTAEGRWVQDREFGLQFRAEMLSSAAPTTKEGIEKYLGSGMVKGIGPIYAKKMVDRFGEQIFDVIETQSARLEELDGIGQKRRKRIKDAWAEQKVIRQIMVFLHSNGVSTSRAVRIYKTYGDDAIEKVRNDPYRLAKDIHGIGFKTADQIAQKIGILVDSLIRACAGLSHVLIEATGDGHCALPVELLKDEAGTLLLVDDKIVFEALARTLVSNDLIENSGSLRVGIELPDDRFREGGRMVSGENSQGTDTEPTRRAQACLVQPGAGHHRWTGCGQDDLGERDPAHPARKESAVSVVCSHGAGREAIDGDHWCRSEDNSPASGGSAYQEQLRP
jgi:hypothetical protein